MALLPEGRRRYNLTRAIDIVRELNHSLDLEAGGQLAETLRNLYNFFESRLVESNLKKSRRGIDEIMPMLKQLRDAWFSMLNGGSLSPALPEPASTWTANSLQPA